MSSSKRIIVSTIAFLSLVLMIFSQSDQGSPALRITGMINIDGVLDEGMWRNAPDAAYFLNVQEDRSDPETVRTFIKVLFDDNYLYIGVRCEDDSPEAVVAEVEGRDSDIRSDDSAFILLEVNSDTENFFVFGINATGTRVDAKVTRDGVTLDPSWNGSWESAGQKTSFGWAAEIAIDLISMQYEPYAEKNMGLVVSRVVPRLDNTFWTGPLDPAFDVSGSGLIRNLRLPRPENRLKTALFGESGTKTGEGFIPGGGLDIRYKFSPLVTGSATVNPSFETVEPDTEIINLTHFESRVEEKRPFFLGGTEPFRQDFELFYSKRIGDIYGGAKFYGRSGFLEFSALSVQARDNEEIGEDTANFSALRLKMSFLGASFLGLTASNKLINGNKLGAVGADISLEFVKGLKLFGQFSMSYGDYSENNKAFIVRPSFDSENFHFHASYAQIEDRFADNANTVGYIPDDNRKELDFGLSKHFPMNFIGFNRVGFESHYNIYWGMDQTLRSWQFDQKLVLGFQTFWKWIIQYSMDYKLNEIYPDDFPGFSTHFLKSDWGPYRLSKIQSIPTSGSVSFFDPVYFFDLLNPVSGKFYYVFMGSKEYRNRLLKVGTHFEKGEWNAFRFTFGFGSFYAEDYFLLEIYKSLQLSRTIYLTYDAKMFLMNDEFGSIYKSTWLHVVHYIWNISEKFKINAFIQYRTGWKKFTFQALGTYTILPPLNIQVVLQKGMAPFGVHGSEGTSLFLRINYAF